jgi:Holliday junction resolvase-like predicted endonuclease
MADRPGTGRLGEDAAELLYVRRGYRVAARNWRCRIGELDLVLRRGDLVVFCEVKSAGLALRRRVREAVDRRKQRKIRRSPRRTSSRFAQAHPPCASTSPASPSIPTAPRRPTLRGRLRQRAERLHHRVDLGAVREGS